MTVGVVALVVAAEPGLLLAQPSAAPLLVADGGCLKLCSFQVQSEMEFYSGNQLLLTLNRRAIF